MKALEFYSGIGGMHHAFKAVCKDGAVACAYEINEIANDVYEHNFGIRPKQGNIEKLSVKELSKHNADIWLLAPPCQPYTRQGLKKDSSDGRARSFLALLKKLPQMSNPPRYLLVENVVGFEVSDTHSTMRSALGACGYSVQEFVLTPSQFGVPYSRPRYFCLAKKGSFLVDAPSENNGIWQCTPSHLTKCAHTGDTNIPPEDPCEVRPLRDFLVADPEPENVLLGKFSFARALVPQLVAEDMAAAHAAKKAKLEKTTTSGHSEIQAAVSAQQQGSTGACDQQGDTSTSYAGHEAAGSPKTAGIVQGSRSSRGDADAPSSSPSGGHNDGGGGGGSVGCVHGTQEATTARSASDIAQEPSASGALACAASTGQHSPGGGNEGAGDDDQWAMYRVPIKVLQQCADVVDVVSPDCCKSNCFTKSYSQYAKGTGSLLAVLDREELAKNNLYITDKGNLAYDEQSLGRPVSREELAELWKKVGMRYFTPREVANLHSFPPEFGFPQAVTLRQRYQLLGNSLSAAVVADLLRYMLADGPTLAAQPGAGSPAALRGSL